MKYCPNCKSEDVSRVMYSGIPAWFCNKDSFLWGIGSYLIVLIPFNGLFVHYSPGTYWSTLWAFLMGTIEEE